MPSWMIFLFLILLLALVFVIWFSIKLYKDNKYYNELISKGLLNLVPLKIDLQLQEITFSEKVPVLNDKKKLSIFVFKAMINHKIEIELEILFQNLINNNVAFTPVNYIISFQYGNRLINYNLGLTHYDSVNKIIYGQMQSNTKYNRFIVLEDALAKANDLIVNKVDFVPKSKQIYQKSTIESKTKTLYEYMILIKIKNYDSLINLLTEKNIESVELLIVYFAKNTLGIENTVVFKYYDDQFLVYSKTTKFKISLFQKKLNKNINSNVIDKKSYLQISTQIIAAYSVIKKNTSMLYTLYDFILLHANNDESANLDLIENKLRFSSHKKITNMSQYELLYSPKIWEFLTIKLNKVYKNGSEEIAFYYANPFVIKNEYYDNYQKMIMNISHAGLWWRVYEPLFSKALKDYEELNTNKDLVVPLLLAELENQTVFTQVLNIIKKRKENLFAKNNLILNFQDNSFSAVNNWKKYENIINILKENGVKVAFSHDFKNINDVKFVTNFKPNLVVLEPNLLKDISVDFDKFIEVSLFLNYLNILGQKNILAVEVKNLTELILLKSLKINYFSGSLFNKERDSNNLSILKYKNYWAFKKNRALKGNK